MTNCCQIENVLNERLKNENKIDMFIDYLSARKCMCEEIYPEIQSKVPGFTYHDESHVINVLENAMYLLGENIEKISTCELYILCLSVLFHDTGLIYGRDEHERNIGNIYNRVRGIDSLTKYGNEKMVLTKIVKAHSGETVVGSKDKDTLKLLGKMNAYNESIHTEKLAAILRFADELAEGGQRTSTYFIDNALYPPESKIFHKYSSVYQSVISPNDNRIAITYNLILTIKENELYFDKDITFEQFLDFVFKRLIKIDEERKYCRFYCSLLDPIKIISADFVFWINGDQVTLDMEPVIFSDKVVPGSESYDWGKYFPQYKYHSLSLKLKQIVGLKTEEDI